MNSRFDKTGEHHSAQQADACRSVLPLASGGARPFFSLNEEHSVMKKRLHLGIAAVFLAFAFGGTAMAATLPDGLKSGTSPQSSGALVTLSLPSVVGVNVGHNFVLNFNSGSTCYGNTGATSFPQAASGNTTYTFAVTTTATDPATTAVACPGANGQADVATVQVFSTFAAATGLLQAGIVDGGQGGSATKFSDLIADIFSFNRLTLVKNGGDTCGGGTAVSPMNLGTSAANLVTAIPATGWSDCKQTLKLTLASGTAVKSGTATGTLTFTISHP
jgi:hypothetical protein